MGISRKFLPLIALGIASCVSAPPKDVTPNSSFNGAAFWIFPAEISKAPFVFRWHRDQAYVSTETATEHRLLSISSCPNLVDDLARLDASVVPSVQIIATPQYDQPTQVYVGHVRYVLKYHADRSINDLRLESYDPHAVPWVAAALAVKDRVTGCLAGS
jgi:hypothetical protein